MWFAHFAVFIFAPFSTVKNYSIFRFDSNHQIDLPVDVMLNVETLNNTYSCSQRQNLPFYYFCMEQHFTFDFGFCSTSHSTVELNFDCNMNANTEQNTRFPLSPCVCQQKTIETDVVTHELLREHTHAHTRAPCERVKDGESENVREKSIKLTWIITIFHINSVSFEWFRRITWHQHNATIERIDISFSYLFSTIVCSNNFRFFYSNGNRFTFRPTHSTLSALHITSSITLTLIWDISSWLNTELNDDEHKHNCNWYETNYFILEQSQIDDAVLLAIEALIESIPENWQWKCSLLNPIRSRWVV